jgi:hypothetical protein
MPAIALTDPTRIEIFRLKIIKQRIKMECLGLRFKGRSTRAMVKQRFGLSRQANEEEMLAAIDRHIATLQP